MIFLFPFFYIPLALKIFSFSIRLERWIPSFPLFLGRVEYFVSPFRDQILSFIFLGYGIYRFIAFQDFLAVSLGSTAFLFSRFNWLHRQRFRLNFCRLILKFPEIEPNSFFDTYYRGLGSLTDPFHSSFPTIHYSSIDYRTDQPSRKTMKPLLKGMIDTLTLAKLAIFAMEKLNLQEGIEAFDKFARIWGSRFAARSHLRLSTLGIETLPPLQGKILLVFNHRSYTDFVLNFFALGDLKNQDRSLRPRFIAAKDHLIDNSFIYSWIGVGKCIQKAGMIFINRQKGKGWLAMQEASEKLIDGDVEVAVYPQGTRAWPMIDEKGKRRDAGYYTTCTKETFEDPLGHLKIGTAQLILDTAISLQEKKEFPLNVLFIGIDGTGTIGPKKSFHVQTESEVTFQIGNLWKVELPENLLLENPRGRSAPNESQKNYLELLRQFQNKIDRELQRAIRWNEVLMKRFLASFLDREEEENKKIKDFLIFADQTHDNLPFMILDRIYTLPPHRWEKYFSAFSYLILVNGDSLNWKKLNEEVSLELLGEK